MQPVKPPIRKNMIKEFFLPKNGTFTINAVKMIAGSSPNAEIVILNTSLVELFLSSSLIVMLQKIL